MAIDRRLKIKSKNHMDKEPFSRSEGFKLGSFLCKMQGISEDFMGALVGAVSTDEYPLTSLRLGSGIVYNIVSDAAPSVSHKGLILNCAGAANDGSIYAPAMSVALPSTTGDKIIFESVISVSDVSASDRGCFIISNEAQSVYDAALTPLVDDASASTYFGVKINAGAVYMVSLLNGGTAAETNTGISLVDGEKLDIKIEVDSDRKASLYLNSSRFKSVASFTFDSGDSLRPVAGIVASAIASPALTVESISIYKLLK